ncbi:MAG: lipoyl synthase [Deltaproteobacteria bacterium]|nr:lipoyl synthase [Deltaproteobacteria bacterium]
MARDAARKPDWLKVRIPGGERFKTVRRAIEGHGLHTVCDEARCPNRGECWDLGTATFLILGDVCTRGCAFCAVARGDVGNPPDPDEPARVARAATEMGLDYAVVTSVTRDDLPDGGASLFAATVRALKTLDRPPLVEVLVPDYLGADLDAVLSARPEVLAHNIEVVERLAPAMRHPRFSYVRSLEALAQAAGRAITKSSILLGLGETSGEVERAMADLRDAGVAILVLGQYLRPTAKHAPVVEYVDPARFNELAALGTDMGFSFVAASPLARTSYRAAEAFVRRAAEGR